MTVSRRALMTYSAAAFAALSTGRASALENSFTVPESLNSPLLSVVREPEAVFLRVVYRPEGQTDANGRRLTIRVDKQQHDGAGTIPVRSVAAAEQMMINCLPITEWRSADDVQWGVQHSDMPDAILDDSASRIMIGVNRSANLIAARTRRGAGNCVLMHPRLAALIISQLHSNLVELRPYSEETGYRLGDRVGRWNFVWSWVNRMDVFTSVDMPETDYVVVYRNTSRGHVDGPGAVFINDGEMRLLPTPYVTLGLGNYRDYMQRVRLV